MRWGKGTKSPRCYRRRHLSERVCTMRIAFDGIACSLTSLTRERYDLPSLGRTSGYIWYYRSPGLRCSPCGRNASARDQPYPHLERKPLSALLRYCRGRSTQPDTVLVKIFNIYQLLIPCGLLSVSDRERVRCLVPQSPIDCGLHLTLHEAESFSAQHQIAAIRSVFEFSGNRSPMKKRLPVDKTLNY